MADRSAVASGNWSDLSTWDGGTDLPAPGDGVYANGFMVSIDQDIDVAFLANDSQGGTFDEGGLFMCIVPDEATANLTFTDGLEGATHFISSESAPALLMLQLGENSIGAITGNIWGTLGPSTIGVTFPSSTVVVASEASGATVSVTGDVSGTTGAAAGLMVGANVVGTITGTVYGGFGDASHAQPGFGVFVVGGDLIVDGPIIGGDLTDAADPEMSAVISCAVYGMGNITANAGLVHGITEADYATFIAMGSVTGLSAMALEAIEALLVDAGELTAVVTDLGEGYFIVVFDDYPPDMIGLARGEALESIFGGGAGPFIPAPTDLAGSYADETLSLTWNMADIDVLPEPIDHYEILWSLEPDYDPGTTIITEDATESYEEVVPLEPGFAYIRVRGIGATLTGHWASLILTLPGLSGWLTVVARGILGLADTSDPDLAPDYTPIAGTVVLTPGLSRPVRMLEEGIFLSLAPVTGTFDSEGVLTYEGDDEIRIVAPQWDNLSNTTWRWTAAVKPGPGQSWSAFSVNFTGAPGDIINLASLI